MNIDELLRKNTPKAPDAPTNELNLLMTKLGPRQKEQKHRRIPFFWMIPIFATAAVAIAMVVLTIFGKKQQQQVGLPDEPQPEVAELVSFTVEAFAAPLEVDVTMIDDPFEQILISEDDAG